MRIAGCGPLGLMARFHLVLCAKPGGGAATPADFVAAAKARMMDYASPGIGSPHHLAMERLARDLGIKLNHVPYRGMAPAMTDLMNGTVEAAVLDMARGRR
jgi:tripartite-type tricarboxylate transporter receptor subunit TctC